MGERVQEGRNRARGGVEFWRPGMTEPAAFPASDHDDDEPMATVKAVRTLAQAASSIDDFRARFTQQRPEIPDLPPLTLASEASRDENTQT